MSNANKRQLHAVTTFENGKEVEQRFKNKKSIPDHLLEKISIFLDRNEADTKTSFYAFIADDGQPLTQKVMDAFTPEESKALLTRKKVEVPVPGKDHALFMVWSEVKRPRVEFNKTWIGLNKDVVKNLLDGL